MKRMFAELARRQVFRVAAAYAVVGWVLLQIVGLLAPNLGLPDWTVAFVFIILGIGFPVSILLAWAFEVTPDGVRRTEGDGAETTGRPLDFALLIFLALVIVISGFGVFRPVSVGNTGPEQTANTDQSGRSRLAIAVLPFADMSPEGDQDWFSDGISEEIIHRLALEKNLTVAGRTSSFYFKGKNVPFEEIGRMLNVGTVLEGSVRKDGTRLRITAQLIDIESGAHRWSGTFDRELKDIFRIQEDLSVSIARELLRELGVEPLVPEVRPYEPNLEAYQAYLRATQVYNSFRQHSLPEAARLYRRAAELDKEYVRPLSMLLSVQAYGGSSWIGPDDRDLYDSEVIVAEALARDPSPVEVLFLKASAAVIDWRFAEAETFYRNRAELKDSVWARWDVAALLTWTGRYQEAIPLLEEGLAEAELDGVFFIVLNFAYQAAGRYEDVIALTDQSIALGLPVAEIMLIVKANAAVAMNDKVLYEQTKSMAAEDYGVNTSLVAWQIWDAQLESDPIALTALKSDLVARYERSKDDQLTSRIAAICELLGEEQAALKWYRRAVEVKSHDFRRQMRFPKEMSILFNTPEGRVIVEDAGYDLAWFDEPEGVAE